MEYRGLGVSEVDRLWEIDRWEVIDTVYRFRCLPMEMSGEG